MEWMNSKQQWAAKSDNLIFSPVFTESVNTGLFGEISNQRYLSWQTEKSLQYEAIRAWAWVKKGKDWLSLLQELQKQSTDI